MRKKITKVFLRIFPLLLLPVLSACSLSFTSSGLKLEGVGDGGVFRSETKGDSWSQVSAIPSINGQARSLGSEDISDIAIDPSDHNSLYLAVTGKGLWYTNSVKDGWNRMEALDEINVRIIKVDPTSKCTVYALSSNRILKTDNCGRDFKQIYQDDSLDTVLTTLVIDYNNHSNLYLGNSHGDILKSVDGGSNWRLIKHLDSGSAVMKLLINPKNSTQIFVASKNGNVYRFISNTKTTPTDSEIIDLNFAVNDWQDFSQVLMSLNQGSEYRAFTISNDGQLFLATNASLVRSKDEGITWEKITVLTNGGQTSVNSLAVNPLDSGEIYYVTNNTLFRSTDGGVSWTTKKLPTGRFGSKLLIDYKNPSIVYLGVIKGQ